MAKKNIAANDFKEYENYYKKNENLKYIGAGMLIVGLFLLWLCWGIVGYIVAPILVVAGLVLFLVFGGGRASEADIDKLIEQKGEKMEVYLNEETKYRRRVVVERKPVYIEGYDYNKEGTLLAKAKNSSIRSSNYTKAIIYMLTDELYIVRRSFSIISDGAQNDTVEIPYAEIKSVEIERGRSTKKDGAKSFLVKECFFVVKDAAGECFKAPIHDDIEADSLAEHIMKLINDYKKAQRDE